MDIVDLNSVVKLVAALVFVLALMGALALGVRYVRERTGLLTPRTPKRRLRILESLPLDARRRLILLECDATQHLVILGTTGETVVQTNIKAPHDSTAA